ncbi:MFS transporter [Nonomuraea sp. NPDC050663]|uniref:MFS transporter n=1 Tax=Nonomuraea sp. NPDC050663 TaxID=3364370 RepID=UPI0037AF6C9C
MSTTRLAGRREWLGLAVLALTTLLLSLDVSVLYLAIPHFSADLGADSAQQLWIMDVYAFMVAGFLVTMGTVGDRIGRRRLLLIGAGAFGLASLAAAYASSPEMLIAMRALLGLAGASLMPSSMALLRTMFQDQRQLNTALSLWFSCFMVGMVIGPLVGGALLEHFWWGSAFLLGVPFMVVLLILGPVLLPEYRAPGAGRLDLVSVLLSLAAILPVVYGLKSLARQGWEPLPAAALLAGAVIGVVFVRRQLSSPRPLLDLRLFADRALSSTMAVLLLGGVVMAGVSLLFSTFLQVVEGLSPLRAGMWMVPQAVMMIVAMTLAPVLARRFPVHRVMAAGLLVSAAGLFLHTQVDGEGSLGLLVTGLSLASAGLAVPMALGNGLIMGSVPQEKAGTAAAMTETGGEFGIAMGVAAFGALATAVYQGALPEWAPQAARESVAAAAAAAATMPDGAALLEAARDAFAAGLNAVAWVSVPVFAGLAVLVLLALGRPRAPRAGEARREEAVPELVG